MGKDVIPASVYNDANSGIYLIAVDGDDKNHIIKIYPGESSKDKVRSIDAIGAYNISNNMPVNLQLSDVITDAKKKLLNDAGVESSWWKIPDGCNAAVININGVPTLKMNSYIPGYGPTPAVSSEWVELKTNVAQNEIATPINNVATASASNNINTALNTKLLEHLNKYHSPEDVQKILLAVNANISKDLANKEVNIERIV